MAGQARTGDFRVRTETVGDGLELPGMSQLSERLLGNEQGDRIWIVKPPELRSWAPYGVLSGAQAVDWSVEQRDRSVWVRAADPAAEVDLVEMTGDVARAFEDDRSESMTVVPTFRPLAGPDGLAEHLVGGHILTGDERGKWPMDQTSAYLYRIARRRGGAFWHAVCTHLAAVTATRVEAAPRGRPVTDSWGKGETHVRYLADACLLLRAHAELTDAHRFRAAADRAADALESFGVPLSGGRWYLHDSVEEERGRNDLVLNTHVHALVALLASGRDVGPGLRALETVLSARVGGRGSVSLGVALTAADLGRAFGPRRFVHGPASRLHELVAVRAAHQRALRFPGGFIARDASGEPAPWYYLSANLADLAVLSRNRPTPVAARALRAGLAFARRGAYLRAQLRAGDGLATVMPNALRNAGQLAEAVAAADRAAGAGFSPVIGWPGYTDALWSNLAPGTP